MRRTFRGILAFILLASICLGVGSACSDSDEVPNVDHSPSGSSTPSSTNLDESYSGKQVELWVGDTLVITLESNASTGYSWALLHNSDESVLNNTTHQYIAPQTTNVVGASGKEEWTFEVLKKGVSTVSMGYSRPWDNVGPLKTYQLTVVVRGVVNVNESHSGQQVELSVGDLLVVTLESNASTGYSWALIQNSDESVLSNTGDKYIDPETNLLGASGKEEWTFQALKKGAVTIFVGYKRPWESVAPVKTFELTVVVSGVVNVNESYSGKQVELSVGDSLVVTLESNAGSTGYSWSLTQNSDGSVLSNTGNKYIAPETTLMGAPGKEEWTFKALKKGTSTISLGYSRPWESIPPAQTFELTVVVK